MSKKKRDVGYLLPTVINPEGRKCVCVPVPDDERHIEAFLAQIFELSRWWTWQEDPEHKGKELAAVWAEIYECVRCNLVCDCGCDGGNPPAPDMQRWTENWVAEESFDGGETWQSSALNEGRFNGAWWPPIPGANGSTKRCQGANSILALLSEQMEKDLALKVLGGSAAEFGAQFIGFLVGMGVITGGVTIFLALVGAALAAYFANKTAEDFESSFTEEAWSQMLCIFFCEMEEDASFTETGWYNVMAALGGQVETDAGAWAVNVVKGLGTVGLTNAARAGRAGSRSCELCDCQEWCYHFDFTTGQHGWQIRMDGAEAYGRYVAGVGFKQREDFAVYDSTGIYLVFDVSTITKVTFHYDPILEGSLARSVLFDELWNFDTAQEQGAGADVSFTAQMITGEIGTDTDPAVGFKIEWPGALAGITFEGTGVNPFAEESNCEPT